MSLAIKTPQIPFHICSCRSTGSWFCYFSWGFIEVGGYDFHDLYYRRLLNILGLYFEFICGDLWDFNNV